MSGPISRRPTGLLDLLLTQQQGRNPAELGDTVSPILDIRPFYDQDRIEIDSATLSAATVGQASTITVPQGEAWQVLTVSSRAQANTAASTIGLSGFVGVGGTAYTNLGDMFHTFVGATDRASFSYTFPSPRIFPSGSQFGVLVYNIDLNAGANIALSTNVLHVRMDV